MIRVVQGSTLEYISSGPPLRGLLEIKDRIELAVLTYRHSRITQMHVVCVYKTSQVEVLSRLTTYGGFRPASPYFVAKEQFWENKNR